jgi:adenine-specific DNA-methyltransferase
MFVSIDDNEVANLRLLIDEVFGMANFVSTLCWQKRVSPANDAKHFSSDHEYVIVVAKRKDCWLPRKLKRTEAQLANYKNPDQDLRGAWNSVTYTCNKSADERPNLYHPITNPNTGEVIWPKKTAAWKFDAARHTENEQNALIYWGADGKSKMPRFKKFLSEMGDVVPRSFLNYSDFGHTQEARTELLNIAEDSPFATPKPSRLIAKLISIGSDKNATILDSFAGSGTTAHAVLKLNAQDGGSRRFILCEMMDYAETITAERVRRVMNGYGEGSKAVAGTGGAFDYYSVGAALFKEDKNLNEDVGEVVIRDYVTYTENIHPTAKCGQDVTHIAQQVSRYALGASDTALWLFYYERNRITTLNLDFLATLNIKALLKNGGKRPEQFIIYADKCALDKDFLYEHGITFKRIPRDITRI